MKVRRKAISGQSLVETVLVLPLLLILLGGGYWFYRDLSLSCAAESAAHAHMLRAGRRLAGIERRLSETIDPRDNVVRIGARNDPLIGQMALFRGLAGRTIASASAATGSESVGGFIDLPRHVLRREAEGAVECWEKETVSGGTVRRTVRGIVASGVLR